MGIYLNPGHLFKTNVVWITGLGSQMRWNDLSRATELFTIGKKRT